MSRKSVTLLILILVGLNFFRFNPIRQSVYVVFDTLVLVHCLIWINKPKKKNIWSTATAPEPEIKRNFTTPLKYLVLSVAISFIPAYIYHDQAVYYSYAIESGFIYVILYGYMHKRRYKIRDLENIIIIVGVLFQVIYWFEIKFQSSTPIFGEYWTEQASALTRLMIWGRHIFMLSFCILLSRFKFTGKAMGFVMISFFTVVLLQTRQLLLPAGLVLIYHFRTIVFKSFFSAIGMILLIGGGIYASGDLFDKIINKTVTQNSQNNLGGDRLQSYIYYLQDKDSNVITRLFGDGFPAPTTAYGDKFNDFREATGYAPGDIGPVGFVTYFGFIWFISLIILMYRGFKIKVPPKYVYTKYYLFVVLLTLPVGENQFVAAASLIALVLTFYIIDKGNAELLEQKRINEQRRRLASQQHAELQLN